MRTLSHTRRLDTQRENLRRSPKAALLQGLERLAQEAQAPLEARVAAIFTYAQLPGPQFPGALLDLAKDATVREFALKALADRRASAAKLPVEPFVQALADTNPRVRLQAANALARIGKRE